MQFNIQISTETLLNWLIAEYKSNTAKPEEMHDFHFFTQPTNQQTQEGPVVLKRG